MSFSAAPPNVANAPAPANPPAVVGVQTSTVLQMHSALAEIKSLLTDIRNLQPGKPTTPSSLEAAAGSPQLYPPSLIDGLANVNNSAESPLLQRLAAYVVIEALPGSGATSATITVYDAPNGGALQPVADAAGTQTVTGHQKYLVGGVQQFFKIRATALTGTWSFLVGFSDTAPLRAARAVGLFAITQDSTANASQTLSQAAPPTGMNNYVTSFEVVISAAAAGGDISCVIQDSVGPTTKYKTFIGSGAARGTRVFNNWTFDSPLGPIAGQAQLVVAAGGASVVTTADLQGFTGP